MLFLKKQKFIKLHIRLQINTFFILKQTQYLETKNSNDTI